MVATASFVPADRSGAMADYYLKETQPEWERNQDLEYQLQRIPDYPGTVPIFQPAMAPQVVDAFRLDMAAMRADPLPQMRNLFAGLRADGGPTGKREMAAYTRGDGKEFVPKKYFDITISNHISVGLAMANAETPAGRALIYSAAAEANSYAVGRLAARLGWTRQGAGGSGGEVPAYPLVISYPHHAARPTQSGFVAPKLHFHNIIFSSVVTDAGRVGALWMAKFGNESIIKTKFDYHDRFESNLNSIGVNTQRRNIGDLVLSDVPNQLNDFFAQRSVEIMDTARENARKRGEDFDALSSKLQHKYKEIAARQTRGSSEDGIANTQQWRMQCALMNWNARDLPRLAANMFNSFVEANLQNDYRRTWQQTRQAIEQSKIRHEPFSFNVKIRRQIVAVALAMKINQFEPKKPNLVQEFANLAKSFTEHKITIAQRLTGRKLVRSLTPQLVELQRMSDALQATQPIQTQPLQKDQQELGSYMASKHNLSQQHAERIAAAGELVSGGKMTITDAVTSIAQGKHHLHDRIERAVIDAASFYDASTVSQTFTRIGSHKPDNTPVVFVASYSDAALARDATNEKLTIIAAYTGDNAHAVMRAWREAEPNRQFIYMTDKQNITEANQFKNTPEQAQNLAISTPPANAAGAQDWQAYARSYGAAAVASNMRQDFKQEFRQPQQAQKIKMD